jgi:hypothetical protein
MDVEILISLHWDLEFHVHSDTFNLAVIDMLTHNLTKKCDQSIAYATRLLNNTKWNYIMTKREALANGVRFPQILSLFVG